MAPKDLKAYDLILMGLLHLHEADEQDLLETIFSFLARKTTFYTVVSTSAARKIILEKFVKYEADAITVEVKKKRDLEEANRKQVKEQAEPERDRLKHDSRKGGKAAVANLSKIRDLTDKEDEKLEKEFNENERDKNLSLSDVDSTLSLYADTTQDSSKICWSTRISGYPQRMQHAAVAVGQAIFSIGGWISLHPMWLGRGPIQVQVLNVNEPELKWKLLPVKGDTIPNQRKNHSAVAYNEYIFIFGGEETKTRRYLNSTCRFNTKTLEWDEVNATGNIPEARCQHSAVVVGHAMIVFGGMGRRTVSTVPNDLHSLDLETLHWSKIETKGIPPACIYGHSATVYKENCIFIFGGRFCEKFGYSTKIFRFDVNSKKWTQAKRRGRNQQPRQSHSAFVHNGLILIFGGSHYVSYLNSLFSYNPETFEWIEVTPIGKPPSPRHRFGSVAIDDRVFIFGGSGFNETYCEDTIILELGCKAAETTVAEQASITASDTQLQCVQGGNSNSPDESCGNISNDNSLLHPAQIDELAVVTRSTAEDMTHKQAEALDPKIIVAEETLDGAHNTTNQDKTEPMKRKRSRSHEQSKLARTEVSCEALDDRSGSLPQENDSSCEDEINTSRFLYGASIRINPSFDKVKIESDFIPPTVKSEPDE